MDLVGPISTSLYGNSYFLSILDDFSRFSWVLSLKYKNDIFIIFLIH